MTNNEVRSVLNGLSRKINYYIRQNDGCTDPEINKMMDEYKNIKENYLKSVKKVK